MKKYICIIMAAMLMLCASGCGILGEEDVEVTYDPQAVAPESREELYSYYDKIDRGMSREEITALFGEGETKYDEDGMEMFQCYRNEKKSAGVNVIYKQDDTVYAKILYYNKAEDLVPFSNEYTESLIPEIKENSALSKAEELFGEGLEIACTYNTTGQNATARIYSWFNADGTNFQIHSTNGVVTSRVLNKPERNN